MSRVLILCIGNGLAADDGAGWVVYQELRKTPALCDAQQVRLKFLGLGGIDMLEELAGEELLVVVDAVQLGEEPGTVHSLGWDQLPFTQLRPVSGHGIGIREAIGVGRKLYPEKMPRHIVLVGIEGECFDQLGEELSTNVADAVPKAITEVVRLVRNSEQHPIK